LFWFNELQLTHKKQSCLEINSFVRGDYSLKAVDFFSIKKADERGSFNKKIILDKVID
jgi:hypothetical protein